MGVPRQFRLPGRSAWLPDAQTTRPVAVCGASARSCVRAPFDLGPNGTQVILPLCGTGIRGLTSLAAMTATIDGVHAQVQSAGATAKSAGLDQVKVLLPRTQAGRGEVDLNLTVDGKAANTVRVSTRWVCPSKHEKRIDQPSKQGADCRGELPQQIPPGQNTSERCLADSQSRPHSAGS